MRTGSIHTNIADKRPAGVEREFTCEKCRSVPAYGPGIIGAGNLLSQHRGIAGAIVEIEFRHRLAGLQFGQQTRPIWFEEVPSALPRRPAPAVGASNEEGFG